MKNIKKLWGREEIITNGPLYCAKILHLDRGFRCSLHHHRVKDETFYILSGSVIMESGPETTYMKPGESVHIPPGTKHRFSGNLDSQILEVSTEHFDEDSYREPGQLSGRAIP